MRRFGPVAERIGITRIAGVTGLDNVGVPVFLAIRPTSKSITVSVGKGASAAAARTAAMMESVEIWHAENLTLGTKTLRRGAIAAPPLVDLDGLPLALGADGGALDAEFECVAGVDLITGAETWVPSGVVSMDFTQPGRWPAYPLARNSNGLASGATRDTALLHAACEIIERDAEWLWRHQETDDRLDLSTVTHSQWRELSAKLAAAGVSVAAWNVTSDVGVPAFGCVVLPREGHAPWRAIGPHDGFACHPDPVRALLAAVTEAVQKRLTYIAGSRDDIDRAELARAKAPGLIAAVRDELENGRPTVRFDEVEALATGSPAGDLEAVIDRLRAAGCPEVVLVDLTRDDLGVPVVKLIVPGMYGPYGSCAPPLRHRTALTESIEERP